MVRSLRDTRQTYSPVTVSQFVLLFSIGRWSRIKQMIDRGEQTKSRINGLVLLDTAAVRWITNYSLRGTTQFLAGVTRSPAHPVSN